MAFMTHGSIALNMAPDLPPVWLKRRPATTDSAVRSRADDRNGRGPSAGLAQHRERVAGEAPHRAQRHMAYDAGDAKCAVLDQGAGQLAVAIEVGADEADQIVKVAAHLPAL